MTIKLIEQLMALEYENTDIIVADNNSNPLEKEKLIDYFKNRNWIILREGDLIDENKRAIESKSILILLDNNYGYAKGNNFGLKLAYKLGYKYAVISNNDVIIEKPIIGNLLEIIKKDESIAVIGPRVLSLKGEDQSPYNRPGIMEYVLFPLFYPIFRPFFKVRQLFKKKICSSSSIYYPYRISGCFMLIKLNYMNKVNYFDESTFLFAEEPILAEKLHKIGLKMAYYPGACIWHAHGESTKILGERKRYFIQLKSDLYYFERYRNYKKILIWTIYLAKLFEWFFWKSIIFSIKKCIKLFRKNE